jgi:hypothetical protein
MNNVRKKLLCVLLTAILLGSCAGQPPAAATSDVNAIMTDSVGTFVASFFQTQTAMVTPATPTPLNTPTFIPTSTPLALPSPLASPTYVIYATSIYLSPTGTQYTATANPSTLASGCNNLSLLRTDLDPDSSDYAPEQRFTVNWKVANTGTCEWTQRYRVVYASGDKFTTGTTSPNNPIPVGKWTTLSLSMNAPKAPGTYTGYWRLSDGAGNAFGATLGVTIVVKKPTYP